MAKMKLKTDCTKCQQMHHWAPMKGLNELKASKNSLEFYPGGYFQIRRSGGLGPHIKFGGKIWGKVRPSSQNKRKNLGSSVTTRRKRWEKVPILGSYLKFRWQNFGVYVIYIFRGKIWGSNKNFRGKIWGQAPRPSNMEVPPWGILLPVKALG